VSGPGDVSFLHLLHRGWLLVTWPIVLVQLEKYTTKGMEQDSLHMSPMPLIALDHLDEIIDIHIPSLKRSARAA
jgi:hypothetical protein